MPRRQLSAGRDWHRQPPTPGPTATASRRPSTRPSTTLIYRSIFYHENVVWLAAQFVLSRFFTEAVAGAGPGASDGRQPPTPTASQVQNEEVPLMRLEMVPGAPLVCWGRSATNSTGYRENTTRASRVRLTFLRSGYDDASIITYISAKCYHFCCVVYFLFNVAFLRCITQSLFAVPSSLIA